MMKLETPRDITYCTNTKCTRNCERNLARHIFRNAIYSISNFGPDKSGECKFYMREDKEL